MHFRNQRLYLSSEINVSTEPCRITFLKPIFKSQKLTNNIGSKWTQWGSLVTVSLPFAHKTENVRGGVVNVLTSCDVDLELNLGSATVLQTASIISRIAVLPWRYVAETEMLTR